MFSARNLFFYGTCLFTIIGLAKLQNCPDVPKLKVVPGFGWDALTNKETKQLLRLTYDECRLTNDGRFLIPDTVFAGSIVEKENGLRAEIFDHWSNYSALSSAGFKVATETWPEQYLPLYYSFSDGYQEMKSLQVKHDAFTCRSQLRRVVYRVHTTSNATMVEAVKQRFVNIIRALVGNDTREARQLAESLVRDYGTHHVKSVDVGTVFAMEHYLKNSFLEKHGNERSKILAAAKLSLLGYTDFSGDDELHLDSSLLAEYNDAILAKRIRFSSGLNWEEDANSEFVAIAKSGDFLSSLATSWNFPKASASVLNSVRQMINDVIRDYYGRNIHRGCTRPKSKNFDFAANLDDGSCDQATLTYVFGGVFDQCTFNDYNIENLCPSPLLSNPLTGTDSCPAKFEPSTVYSRSELHVSYFGGYSWKSHAFAATEFVSCMALANESVETSYLFGGLYSSDVNNIHTKTKRCPASYTALTTKFGSLSLSICVNSANDDSAKRYSLPFGGFASCSNEYQCPLGYTKYLALKFNPTPPVKPSAYHFVASAGSNCNIYYCLLEDTKLVPVIVSKAPLLIRPPFENNSNCSPLEP